MSNFHPEGINPDTLAIMLRAIQNKIGRGIPLSDREEEIYQYSRRHRHYG